MELSPKGIVAMVITSALTGGIIAIKYQKSVKPDITDQKVITKDQIVTVVHEVTKPDGSKITDTKKTEEFHQDENILIPIIPPQPLWRISGGVGYAFSVQSYAYSIQLDRRLIGPIWVGIRGNNLKEVDVMLGVEF